MCLVLERADSQCNGSKINYRNNTTSIYLHRHRSLPPQVTYPNATAVTYGDPLTPTQVKDTPTVEWPAADADSFYTLIMTDPDAPSRHAPELREWQHWTVVNIPGANLTAGDTLTEYVGAGPPKGTGLHRYVFLLFKQQHQHAFGEPLLKRTDANRTHFNTRAFAEKHQLGAAVAGNLFQAEYDDYVPTLYAQFE